MKTNKIWAVLFAATVAMTSFSACDPKSTDGGDGEPSTGESLEGTITGEKTLAADILYTITAPVIVEDGGTLTIPAGTRIEAKKQFSSYILVLTGGTINVNGTETAPVVMTSAATNPANGDWGGLIINGLAPLTDGIQGSTEISSTYKYGGDDEGDNSGSITYLVLEYTGAQDPNDEEVEHNGLTLNAVGNGTTIKNVFVNGGMDDGIEFFGGSVNVSNLLVVNPDDDMFDITFGYSGTLNNAYGIWEEGHGSNESDPSGVEADGNLDGDQGLDKTPQSDFTISNMTIDLRLAYDANLSASPKKFMQNALRVRRGAIANITNALVKGTGHVQNFVNLNDSKGGADVTSEISVTNELETAPDNMFVPYAGNSGAKPPISALTEADYTEVSIEDGNTGCATSIFDWTGYDF